MADPNAIPLSIAESMARAAVASLDEARASRKELRAALTESRRESASLRDEVASLRADIAMHRSATEPALAAYKRHLDALDQSHTAALSDAKDARTRLLARFWAGLSSGPAMAALGAAGTAAIAVIARWLGLLGSL